MRDAVNRSASAWRTRSAPARMRKFWLTHSSIAKGSVTFSVAAWRWLPSPLLLSCCRGCAPERQHRAQHAATPSSKPGRRRFIAPPVRCTDAGSPRATGACSGTGSSRRRHRSPALPHPGARKNRYGKNRRQEWQDVVMVSGRDQPARPCAALPTTHPINLAMTKAAVAARPPTMTVCHALRKGRAVVNLPLT